MVTLRSGFPVDRQGLRLGRVWWACGIAMLVVVAGVSLMPVDGIDIGASDKTLHLLTYCLLSSWFCLLARNRPAVIRSVLALIAYGVLIEGLQSMTGYRYAEWGDVVANASGCLLGVLGHAAPLRRLFNRVDAMLASMLFAH